MIKVCKVTEVFGYGLGLFQNHIVPTCQWIKYTVVV